MRRFEDDSVHYKKKSIKKTPKKSNHKHEYRLIEKKEMFARHWFKYFYSCEICGKSYTELKVEK